MLKKFFAVILALATLSTLIVPAGAALITVDDTNTETFIIAKGGSATYTNEDGQKITEEFPVSMEVVSARDVASVMSTQEVFTHRHIKYFEGHNIEAELSATFDCSPGYEVSCTDHSYNITPATGYSIARSAINVTAGAASQWCKVTLTADYLKPNSGTDSLSMWITCYRSGKVTTG